MRIGNNLSFIMRQEDTKMIQKYVYGHPINTDAVVMEIPERRETLSVMELTESDGVRLCCRME